MGIPLIHVRDIDNTYNFGELSDGVQVRFGALVAATSQCIGRGVDLGPRVQDVHCVVVHVQLLNRVQQVLIGL